MGDVKKQQEGRECNPKQFSSSVMSNCAGRLDGMYKWFDKKLLDQYAVGEVSLYEVNSVMICHNV